MKKREISFSTVVFLLLLAFAIFGLSKTGILISTRSFLERVILFPQGFTFNLFSRFSKFGDQHVLEFEDENKLFIKKLVDQKNLEKENQALRDQFKTAKPKSENLLPVKVIGLPSFIPNVTPPENLIIDRGSKDGVSVEQAVIFKDNLVGKVVKTSSNLAMVDIVSHKNFSFTAKTAKNEALGVIKGKGNGDIVFENVLLSETLNINDIILTKGDFGINGVGIPSELVVGKIVSVDKKASSLFQSAKVQSLLDFTKLDTVFVVLGN